MKLSVHRGPAHSRAAVAFRASSCRGREALRRPLRIVAKGEPDDFKRNAAQQLLKDADDSVRDAQKGLGSAINNLMGPFGKAVGMGGLGKTKNPVDPAGPRDSKRWTDIQPFLVGAELQSVLPEEVLELMSKGYVFVSVIPSEDYNKYHPKGSVNVPLYEYIGSVKSPMQALRKAAFAAQAVRPIEASPDFEKNLRAAAEGAKGIVFACNSGGTIRSTDNFPKGQSSRSLISAALALRDPELKGLDVKHLRGGLNVWFRDGFEGEGTAAGWEDTSGRVPSVPGFTAEQDAEEMM